jgi:hypothetical protein
MPVTKLTISLPEDLAENIRAEAEAEGTTVSAWLAERARRSLLLAQRKAAVADYEAEFGKITDEEIEEARRWAGRSTPAP